MRLLKLQQPKYLSPSVCLMVTQTGPTQTCLPAGRYPDKCHEIIYPGRRFGQTQRQHFFSPGQTFNFIYFITRHLCTLSVSVCVWNKSTVLKKIENGASVVTLVESKEYYVHLPCLL